MNRRVRCLILILLLGPWLAWAEPRFEGRLVTDLQAVELGSAGMNLPSNDGPSTTESAEEPPNQKVTFEVGKKISSILAPDAFRKIEPTHKTEAGFCQNCDRVGRHNNLISQARDVEENLDPNDPRGYRLPGGFSHACSSAFLTKDGLGPWGKAMVNAAVTVAPQCFYQRNLFGSICPNYLSLSNSQKNALIAMTFAAIAETESACKPQAEAAGVNDLAVGMFQLENSARVRRAAGRNSKWCRTNAATNAKSWEFQSECAVSIIEDTVCSWKSIIFDSAGYWEKLRNNREISQRIRTTAKKWNLCE